MEWYSTSVSLLMVTSCTRIQGRKQNSLSIVIYYREIRQETQDPRQLQESKFRAHK